MTDSKITPHDLETILKLVQSAEHLGDFHLKYGDFELRVSRMPAGAAEGASAATMPRAAEPMQPVAAAVAADVTPARRSDAIPPGMAAVKAPMVGTFYRSPSPGAPAFIDVGSRVARDTVICIIEVMKLMNTVHAGTAGTVREIRPGNSEPVEFGQVLVVIEPDE
jgi:acetyl-CoA carboxylase biotin carboxyl carrier protein